MKYLSSLILFISLSVWGQELQIPALTSPVMDQASFFSEAEREDLSRLIYEIHTHQGPQITLLTVPDLQDYPIEEFAIRVAEKWKLGTKEKGNGLLIIVSRAERKVRIEVGEGIEGEITDFDANQYINQVLVPAFKEGQFHGGLRVVIEDIARRFNIKLEGQSAHIVRRPPTRSNSLLQGILPLLMGILVIGHLFLRRRPFARGLFSGAGMAGVGTFMVPGLGAGSLFLFFIGFALGLVGISNLLFGLASSRGYRGGGFGGGGFGGGGGWGGGGGGFSGGGSSGSW